MKLKNFNANYSVSLYTVLNKEVDTVYINEFQENEKLYNNDSIYNILNVIEYDDEEYWEIKSLFDKQPIGWVKANNHVKMLNTLSQKVMINDSDLVDTLNVKYHHNSSFDNNTFYSKRYMTIYNNEIYFGLFNRDRFVGFANIDALNLGQIDKVEFDFKEQITRIYPSPDLKNPLTLKSNANSLVAESYFNLNNIEILGFTFNEKTYWVNVADINVRDEIKISSYNYSKQIMSKEYYMYCSKANKTEYYSNNINFDTTKKLKKIINSINTEQTENRLYKPFNVKIGIICDEFMYKSLKDSANVEYIPFVENIKVNRTYDIVLIVSSWRGIDESWQYIANPEGEKRKILNNLLDEYNKVGIPTIFYSKEDPVNYDRFLSIAKKCKYIYTSAIEIMDKYKQDTENNNIDYLQFSINPKYHNPVGKDFSKTSDHKQVIFAGSWMKKYPIRNQETKYMFDGVLESNAELNIVDRNFDRVLHDYQFPYQYTPYLSKTLQHEDLMTLHKATSWGINLNSVKYSNTMFANRVYELQAMGNLVLSNYSMGVNNIFPHVSITHNKEDVRQTINSTTIEDKIELIAKGISNVMLNHTAYHRIHKILVNLGHRPTLKQPKILVVGEGLNSKESFNNQFYESKNYISESDLTEEIIVNHDYISYFKDDYIYEENYLANLLSAFGYTDADVIEMSGENKYSFKEAKEINKYKSLIYIESIDKEKKIFNIPETEILESVSVIEEKEKEKLVSVIIPIHNNGKYLEDKCFRSLKKSSIFKNMEIIMIDDGSSDPYTLKVIDRLRRRNPDIVYYRFKEGSGSASRPRNKGIKMATAKYITFLDPDNEASGDGYSNLLKELESDNSLDLVLGNVLKEDNTKKSLLNYRYYVLINNEGSDVVENPKEFLIKANLRAHSIQALIVKTEILKENNLEMIEGAIGQDTLFFQELLLHTNKFKAISETIHIYYAAVEGSVTTTIKLNFFEKYLILEHERVLFLKKHGLFNIYVNQRLPYYFNNWYLKRLSNVSEDEIESAKTILREIFNLYINEYDGNDKILNENLHDMLGLEISIS